MLKLKYKFKKIIRFINKILRVILIFGCFVSLLTFNASAAVYRDDDNFFDVFAGSSAWVSVDHDVDVEDYLLSSPKELNYVYYYTVPSSLRGLKFCDFYIDEPFLSRIQEGNIILLKGSLLFRGGSVDGFSDFLVDNKCKMEIDFIGSNKGFVMKSDITPTLIQRSCDSRLYAKYEFDINFTIPSDIDFYDDPKIHIRIDLNDGYTNSSFSNFYIGSDSLYLYVGDENNAPIYPEYNDNVNDNYSGYEENLMNESQAGFDEFNSLRGEATEILQSGSFLNGALFVTNIYNHLTRDLPWFNSILKVSLTLGLFVVLLSTSFHPLPNSN